MSRSTTQAGTIPLSLVCLVICSSLIRGDEPRLNQIQVISTHNSYRLAPDPAILKLIASAGHRADAEALDYSHRPLPEQFSKQGIRQVELDLFADPAGGLFAAPLGLKLIRAARKDPKIELPTFIPRDCSASRDSRSCTSRISIFRQRCPPSGSRSSRFEPGRKPIPIMSPS